MWGAEGVGGVECCAVTVSVETSSVPEDRVPDCPVGSVPCEVGGMIGSGVGACSGVAGSVAGEGDVSVPKSACTSGDAAPSCEGADAVGDGFIEIIVSSSISRPCWQHCPRSKR